MNPLHPAGRADAIKRGQRVLDELVAQGILPPAALPTARAQLAAITLSPIPRRPDAIHEILAIGKLIQAGRGPALDPADPRLRATIDLRLQAELAAMLRGHLARWREAGAQQAAAMVVRRDGREVLAAIGSAGDGGPGGAIDFSRAPRSPGSTLKPFLYALALDRGVLRADEVMQDRPDGAAGIGNADGFFLGPLLPRQALANSRNVPAATLLRRIGLQTAFAALRDFGLHDSAGPAERFGLAMAIGALPSTLERLVRGYATLADGGRDGDLVWLRGTPAGPRKQVVGEDAARLVGAFLSDPMARLPSFPRYGDGEFPFPVALKTGTSQGYRDAWTLAWSRDYVVGVWVGRADAGPMRGLSGARAAGGLASDILLALHGATRADLTAGELPAPAGRVATELCTETGTVAAACAGTLTEWVGPPAPDAPTAGAVRLSIIAPDQNSRIWRNPEVPGAVNRLVLRAAAEPRVPQVVWLVDGAPVATADPAKPFLWPMTPGAHRFQIRLPFAATASASVRVVVE
jgi:penicillin-binding protein 1C